MARNSSDNEKPNTAPDPDRWYNLSLGSSFKNHRNSPKFCTLRYEFKPTSIDKTQPGSLHKGKNNKVRVEFNNNQYGKRNVMFDGVSENYKQNDAVLFFDGESFHLERLHHAVKRLRHVRLPGGSVANSASPVSSMAVPATLVSPIVESYSSPVSKVANQSPLSKDVPHQVRVQVEQVGSGDSESSGAEPKEERTLENPSSPRNSSTVSPDVKNSESEEYVDIVGSSTVSPDEYVDILNDHNDDLANGENTSAKGTRAFLDIDINLPHQADSDVDISDNEFDKGPNAAEALKVQVNLEGRKEHPSSGPNAAEALRAQVNAEGRKEHPSSSSGSSRSESRSGSATASDSHSGSSSSDSESSNSGSISV